MDTQLQYPIGQLKLPKPIKQSHIQTWIRDIAFFPTRVQELVGNLDEDVLTWKYRPKGWTIKQVIHHCADSHINAFIRFKWALTETNPTIKAYFEDRWAKLTDYEETDILVSIKLLEGLHHRWVILLENMTALELERTYVHPEYNKQFTLAESIGMYAWHSNHHLAHIQQAIESRGKYNILEVL